MIGDTGIDLDEIDSRRKLAVNVRRSPSRDHNQWYNEGGFTAHKPWELHMFGSLGLPELLIILFIVVLIFGANRLPSLARGIGSSVKNFKEGMKDGE
jgi:sec-independent protein translocase protein TatA